MSIFYLKAALIYWKRADEILKQLDIPYEQWDDGDMLGGYEIRVDIQELSKSKKEKLFKEFDLNKELEDFDFIIFHN